MLEGELLKLLTKGRIMRLLEMIPLRFGGILLAPAVLAAGLSVHGRRERVNQEAAIIQQFDQRVAAYVQLQKAAKAHLPALKPEVSPAKILNYEHALAARIRAARPHANQGNIFTPSVAREFRRLIQITMHTPQAGRIRTSLQRGAQVKTNVVVNHSYPAMTPVETTPPSLLLNLPKLPAELEYRVVGHDLVLHDVEADLVVDFVPRAIP
jgi:hypothetical protein